jgi:hypothetical protein
MEHGGFIVAGPNGEGRDDGDRPAFDLFFPLC